MFCLGVPLFIYSTPLFQNSPYSHHLNSYENIIQTEKTYKKIHYVGDLVCWWLIVKNAKIL